MDYLIVDHNNEMKFGFNLEKSLKCAQQRKLFTGKKFFFMSSKKKKVSFSFPHLIDLFSRGDCREQNGRI